MHAEKYRETPRYIENTKKLKFVKIEKQNKKDKSFDKILDKQKSSPVIGELIPSFQI